MIEFQHILADAGDIAPVIIIVAIIVINGVVALFKKGKEAMEKQQAEAKADAAPTPMHSQQQPEPTSQRATASKQTQAVQSIADFFGLGEALNNVTEPDPAPVPPRPRAKAKPKLKPIPDHGIAVAHEHEGDDTHRLVNNVAMMDGGKAAPSLGASMLRDSNAARNAFIAHELFAPPKALRDEEPTWV